MKEGTEKDDDEEEEEEESAGVVSVCSSLNGSKNMSSSICSSSSFCSSCVLCSPLFDDGSVKMIVELRLRSSAASAGRLLSVSAVARVSVCERRCSAVNGGGALCVCVDEDDDDVLMYSQ